MKENEFPTPDSLFIDLPAGIRGVLLIQTAQAIEEGINPFKEDLARLPLNIRLDFIIDSLEMGRRLALPYRQASLEIEQILGERLTQAQNYERSGEIQSAVALYEQNVGDGFLVSLPYERLRIIYEKKKDYENAIRVCKRYIQILQMVSEIWEQYPNIRQIPNYQEKIKKLTAKLKTG